MGAIDHLSNLFRGLGPERYEYTGRALVTLDRVSLLDVDPSGLPDLVGQLDIAPGVYEVRLMFVRRAELERSPRLQRDD